MSCRRSDQANFIGCRIGDVALRGCSRGCCPYPDSEVSQNTREHLLSLSDPTAKNEHHQSAHFPPRAKLYYPHCHTHHAPKYICPANTTPHCRRIIKPFFNPEKHEYRVGEAQDWWVRPLREKDEKFREVCERERGLKVAEARRVAGLMMRWRAVGVGEGVEDGNGSEEEEKDGVVEDLVVDENGEEDEAPTALRGPLTPLSRKEYLYLRARSSELWWTPITNIPATATAPATKKHNKRCPGCGGEVLQVGSNFRVPKRWDEKAWREIEGWIAEGRDLVGEFVVCWTPEGRRAAGERVVEMRSEGGSGGEGEAS